MNDYQLQLECDLALKRVMAKVDEIVLDYYYPSKSISLPKKRQVTQNVFNDLMQQSQLEHYNRMMMQQQIDPIAFNNSIQQYQYQRQGSMGVLAMMQAGTNILGSVGLGYNYNYKRRR